MKKFIWGTGRLVGKVIDKFIDIKEVEAFIDNNYEKKEYMGKKVYRPEEVVELDYDAICVANLYSDEIYKQCLDIGININKVIFLYNNCKKYDMNQNYLFVKDVLGEEYAKIVQKRYHIISGVEASDDLLFFNNEFENGYDNTDYVRIKVFELVVKEIRKKNVAGAVAEVGVFRGEFAQYINYAFPDRRCYLFDTFEGFDIEEALKEMKSGNCTNAFVQAYKDTDISIVLKKMKNIKQIVVKKGYFPNSLDEMEETFSFVSLDVDFEKSIYEGLSYFYPRLTSGGYIFIHDYNSSLLGVEKAVDRYEKNIGKGLCKVPICDTNGTLVITKP